MKPFLACLLTLALAHIAHAQNRSDEQFVRACNAIYLCDVGVGDDQGASKALAGQARRYLASLSARQKQDEFKRLSHLPLATNAAQSVAYVAANRGLQPYANARTMLYYQQPSHPMFPRMDGAGESVFAFIAALYNRFQDRRIALLLLEEPGDGAGVAAARSARLSMLKRQPRLIFALTMQSKKAFAILAEDFTNEDLQNKDFQTLDRLCHDANPTLKRGARQIRQRIHTNPPNNQD